MQASQVVVLPNRWLPPAAMAHSAPRRKGFIEGKPAPPIAPVGAPSVGGAEIVRYDPENVALTVTTNSGGFLVLSDLFYQGWKAFVDDHEVPIYRANYLFRAVPLDPGSWFVRFEYHPASFRN